MPTSGRSSSSSWRRCWRLDPFTAEIVKDIGFQNFETLWQEDVYREIAQRTFIIAGLVTLADALLAFPIAFYMAKIARPRVRAILLVAVLMPLWSSYLVKVFAWRTILQRGGHPELGARSVRGEGPRGSATSPRGSSSRTSGCRS